MMKQNTCTYQHISPNFGQPHFPCIPVFPLPVLQKAEGQKEAPGPSQVSWPESSSDTFQSFSVIP